MASEDYKNNPLYTDITKLDHLSPQPTFAYKWNIQSGRWEPSEDSRSEEVENLLIKLNESNSGMLSSSEKLLSGIREIIDNQEESNIFNSTTITKTVNQKIEEDFILMENIPDDTRGSSMPERCYGQNKFIMNDIFNVHFENARTSPESPETGHPEYFIHEETIDTGRCAELNGVFHTDTNFSLRQENSLASQINSYELLDFSELYQSGLAESVVIFNESPYPIQFHTIDKSYYPDPDQENNLIYLYPDGAVQINTDEAKNVYVKRPHTISGYTIKYSINYKGGSVGKLSYDNDYIYIKTSDNELKRLVLSVY
jgi:hypothetical protein